MIKTKAMAFVVLLIAFVNLKVSAEWIYQVPDCKKNNCGKIIGQIYDSQTQEKVNEEFFVYFLDCLEIDEMTGGLKVHFCFKTENNGEIFGMIPEDKYFIVFKPCSLDSNYSFDPFPNLNPDSAQSIVVNRDKIAWIKKFAKTGGTLKISLVDSNNLRIDPRVLNKQEYSIKAFLSSSMVNRLIFAESNSSDHNELNDGEMVVRCLPPALYDLYVTFEELGYGYKKIVGINIEQNKISEVNVVFDKNDRTGIYGRILDKVNKPLSNVNVLMELIDNQIPFIRYAGNVSTDENGYYKINGLKEGIYNLKIFGEFNGTLLEKSIQDIIVINDVMLKKDIVEN